MQQQKVVLTNDWDTTFRTSAREVPPYIMIFDPI